jgi:glutathione S-transferase
MSSTKIKDLLQADTTYRIAYGDQEEDLEEPRFILGYWSIRGLAAPLRMMLAAAEVNHWVIMYDVCERTGEEWGKHSYLKDKVWLKQRNPLMNAPFLVDCATDRVIVQTNAIFTFLGRELNMMGSTPDDCIKCEELLCEVMDIRNQMVRFAYASGTDNNQQEAENLMKKEGSVSNCFDKVDEFIKKGHSKFLVGDNLSAPDFHLWEMMDQFIHLCEYYNLEAPFHESKRQHLFHFFSRFQALPNVKPYIDSELFNIPFNNPYARFGSDPVTKGQYKRGMETPWKGKGVVDVVRKRTSVTGQKRKF